MNLTESLNKYLKQNDFERFLKSSKLKAPVLVTGHSGLPLLEAAKFLAKTKLCAQDVCLECSVCRSIESETSYQVRILRPEGQFIKVDQIREVLQSYSYKSESLRILIIDQAHKMNLQSANALLKTLEEPPENCWILLTAPSLKNVLSTIRSRCIVFKQKSLSKDFFKTINLKSDFEKEILNERWDWGLDSEGVLARAHVLKEWVSKLKSKNLNEELESLPEVFKGKESFAEALQILRLILKSEVLKQTEESSVLDRISWIKLFDQIQLLENSLFSNVDLKLIEDHLISSIKESRAFH